MAQYELESFLINMKMIYQHGVSHSKNKSKMQRLFAIHSSHYVVEQIIREQAKDLNFKDALHNIGFQAILKKLHKPKNIQDYNRLLELNRIRNDAEHLNIIPDVDTVRFYVKIVGDFLIWSYREYYGINYESLALEEMILDAPIRRVMLEAKELVEKNDLVNASKKMFEGLGAFKFMSFGFLSDPRTEGWNIGEIDLPNVLADLAFKIILANDESALKKIMLVKTKFTTKNGKVTGVKSFYPEPKFRDKEEAKEHYEQILNIILTYQEKMPSYVWRTK